MNNRFVTAVTGSGVARWALATGLLLGLSTTAVHAQRKAPAMAAPVARESGDPGVADLAPRKAGFSMFAQADAAASGVNMSGSYTQPQTNYGLCGDQGQLAFGNIYCQILLRGTSLIGASFGMQLTAGAPRTEFRKIRSLYPGVAAARGDGYTAQINIEEIQAGPYDFGPRDNTLGVLFAGVSSTSGDGSCRDQDNRPNGYINGGVSLLARSDCPVTFAAGGFDGPRPIPDSAYIRAFQADPNGFTFDYFRIPQSEKNLTRFLGNTSTYGEISDHYAEQLELFGSVTPRGTGAPQITGYPIGLAMHFEAFAVSLPTVANAQFYQMTVINRSADVYGGAGIDYDSLYMGMTYSSQNSAISGNVYWVPGGRPGRDLPSYMVSTGERSSRTTNCNGGFTDAVSIGACPTTATPFTQGAAGVIMLKSPIGDMRNKLLSRPGPFFNPTSPFADDTITYNHGHTCGYGGCSVNTWGISERSGFGMMSSTEANVLDGRDVTQLAPASSPWRIFRNESYPLKEAKFTRYVPGNWDYNNDGIQDTLSYTTCSTRGCVATYGDTLPGKQRNNYNNAMAPMTAGPFKLAAGDTTSFIYAFFGGIDSTATESIVSNAYQYYMNFYLGPEAPPSPPIASTEVGVAAVQEAIASVPYVRLYFGPGPDDFVDPFLANFASQVAAGTDFVRIRNLNPALDDSIRARSLQNFRELLIYRSCDNGNTFDANGDCVGDPANGLDGLPIGPGFRPYAVLPANATTGDFTKVFTDANVTAGRTYLYSVVTRSIGFTTTIRDVDPTDQSAACLADSTGTACRIIARTFLAADSLTSTLPTSGPSTARVYVPISLQAGTSLASFTSSTRTFTSSTDSTSRVASTVPVFVRFGQNVQPGRYRALFANRFIFRSVTNRTTGVTRTTVQVQDVVTNARRGNDTTAAGTRVISDTTLFGDQLIFVGDSAGFTPTTGVFGGTSPSTADDSTVVSGVVNKFGVVFISPTGEPLFISTDLRSDGVTPNAFIASENSTGFVVRFDQSGAVAATAPASEFLVRQNGDTTTRGILDAAAVQFRETESTRRNGATGRFEVLYSDDPYGPGAPFRLDFANPAATESAIVASLNARVVADTGFTSARLQTKARALGGSLATATLVPVDFPFTVSNSAVGSRLILSKIRQPSATSVDGETFTQTLLLGQNTDTLRIRVPENKWVPGDVLVAFQIAQRDSTVGTVTILDNTSGLPIQVTDTTAAFGPFVLGCNAPRSTCNPIQLQTPGATGYLTLDQGDKLVVNFTQPFTLGSMLTLDIVAPATPVGRLSNADLDNIRVVPNPYVFAGGFDQVDGGRNATSQVYFTGVPSSGTLRVYSVSGQFIQELRWTAADLNGTGDLPYNLRSREGTDLASGLYIFVINTNAAGSKQTARGKFVVIR